MGNHFLTSSGLSKSRGHHEFSPDVDKKIVDFKLIINMPGPPKICFLEVFCYIKPTKKYGTFGCLGGFPMCFSSIAYRPCFSFVCENCKKRTTWSCQSSSETVGLWILCWFSLLVDGSNQMSISKKITSWLKWTVWSNCFMVTLLWETGISVGSTGCKRGWLVRANALEGCWLPPSSAEWERGLGSEVNCLRRLAIGVSLNEAFNDVLFEDIRIYLSSLHVSKQKSVSFLKACAT